MSIYSCSPYCDLDERFHDLLKYELSETSCYMGKEELMGELLKKRQVLDELINKLSTFDYEGLEEQDE